MAKRAPKTAYGRHMAAKAADSMSAGGKAAAASITGAVGSAIMAGTGFGLGPAAVTFAASQGLGLYAREKRQEAIGQRNRGHAISDLAARGRLSGADAARFEQANRHYEASHMGHAGEPEQVSQVAPGKRGWANPKVQAAAQAAKGNRYRGPVE